MKPRSFMDSRKSSMSTGSPKLCSYHSAASAAVMPELRHRRRSAPSFGRTAYEPVSALPTTTSAPSGTKVKGWNSMLTSVIRARQVRYFHWYVLHFDRDGPARLPGRPLHEVRP